MRVCYISTYPPIECGIAMYTQYLSDAVKDCRKEVVVISQVGALGEKVFPIFSPCDNDIANKLFHIASKLTSDIIHIQHEFGLYGSERGIQILDFILRCKIADVPVVTTLHTVNKNAGRSEHIILENIVKNSSAIIVHEEYQKEILVKEFGCNDKIFVIAHGVRECKYHAKAKELLNIKDNKVVLLIGYFRPTKCFDKIVKLFPEVVKNINDAVLLVAGKMRGLEYSDYQEYFFNLINNSPVIKNIHVLRGQFPQHTFDNIMSAADVVVLPYEKGAQSGILAQSSAFNIPAVTSDLLSFKLWNKESGGGLTAFTEKDYIKHICDILTDDKLKQKLKSNIIEYNKGIFWSEIAKKHFLVYENVIKVPYGEAEYFYIPEDNE
ncbi:D-inositol-3-phosphate glycosyltransferase [subsurface metagenome]